MAVHLITFAPSIQKRLFGLAILGCSVFFFMTVAAMFCYSDGTAQDHFHRSYLFFQNPFSDLGRTRSFDGRPNPVSRILFTIGMLGAATALSTFFTAFAMAMRINRTSRILSFSAALIGNASACCFIGVACTPWDLHMSMHMRFVLAAFRFLLLATVAALLALLVNQEIKFRLVAPFAAFIILLIGYIVLLTHGPAGNATLQSTGQKIIAYAAIGTIMMQSNQMRIRLPSTSIR